MSASIIRLLSLAATISGSIMAELTVVEDFPTVVTSRCSDYNLSGFTNAMNCGPPLSAPCFDFTRCADGPTVYVYDPECSLADSSKIRKSGLDSAFRKAAKNAGLLAEKYEEACFFVNSDKHEPQCATTAPLWNGGRNHVMFDLNASPRDGRPSYSGSFAMEAATSQHSCYYRTGYDISVGHSPKVVFHELQSTPPQNRRYFLTFRGTLYHRRRGSEERASIMGLHDEASGVIVAEKCTTGIPEMFPQHIEKCAELSASYAAYDYGLLMNTTFGLVPGGASPGSFRLGEVMSAGAIPVIVVRDYVKPFTEQVDWSAFSFTFSPEQAPDMLRTLRAVPPETVEKMQRKSLEAYWKIYGGHTGYDRIIHHVLDIVVKRIGHRES